MGVDGLISSPLTPTTNQLDGLLTFLPELPLPVWQHNGGLLTASEPVPPLLSPHARPPSFG